MNLKIMNFSKIFIFLVFLIAKTTFSYSVKVLSEEIDDENARIYKKRIPALKFKKKVNGVIVKDITVTEKVHGNFKIQSDEIRYIIYYGKYKGC